MIREKDEFDMRSYLCYERMVVSDHCVTSLQEVSNRSVVKRWKQGGDCFPRNRGWNGKRESVSRSDTLALADQGDQQSVWQYDNVEKLLISRTVISSRG